MKASVRSGRRIRVYAVEKNPNAVVHIQVSEWWVSEWWVSERLGSRGIKTLLVISH